MFYPHPKSGSLGSVTCHEARVFWWEIIVSATAFVCRKCHAEKDEEITATKMSNSAPFNGYEFSPIIGKFVNQMAGHISAWKIKSETFGNMLKIVSENLL